MNKKSPKIKLNPNANIEDYLENIVEQIPYFIFWKDTECVYLGCNQKFAHLVNKKSPQDVIGETDFTLGWGEGESELFRYGDQDVLKGIPIIDEEEVLIRPDGSRLIMLVNKLPMRDKRGNCIGILGTSVDITERKKLEENLRDAKEKAEVASRAKTAFLENMRHDIRTPLTGIVGCAHLIQMQWRNPKKVHEYADDLIESSNALMDFLNRVLESITVASGEIPLLKQRFDLYEILKQPMRLNRSQAMVKGLDLLFDYDSRIPVLIGDPTRVQKIILELLTNALKYTDKGQIKVSAQLIKNEKREIIIELRVSDTGMGIPKEKQHEIYKPFTRLTPSAEGIYSGTGMGLSVVKQFIDDLNGEIHLESEVGKGATFSCLIPFQASLLNEQIDKLHRNTLAVFDGKGVSNQKVMEKAVASEYVATKQNSVLLVEDNEIAARVAKSVLSEQGCQVDIATDGKTALKKLEKNTYHLVLMDVGLPGEDGCEVTRQIRLKQAKKNLWIPIIGITAHIAVEKRQRCLANGMNAVYNKPLTAEKLEEILTTFAPVERLSPDKPESSIDALQLIPLLDFERAIKLVGHQKFITECLSLLIKELNEDLPRVKQEYKAKNWRAMKDRIHKWKGGASYCGATRLMTVCQQLYSVLENPSVIETTVTTLYQQLLQVVEQTQQAAINTMNSN